MVPLPHCTYLLPIRRAAFSAPEAAELAEYFRSLAHAGAEVLVVDGSPPEVFARHGEAWTDRCQHEPVDRRFGYLNDKVNGIHTGVEIARFERIILADDDIRYTAEAVRGISEKLESVEVVRPQNYLAPLTWWGRMEAARMLINRATLASGDYPGTCAFRRETMLRVGHYDGDVLFDNEEIVRHFAGSGATIDYALDLFVCKRPPTLRKWFEQRPRQAYEDFGLRAKSALFFALPVLLFAAGVIFGWGGFGAALLAITASAILLAQRGRARGRARDFFPASTILFAPLWVIERSLSTYWALGWYLFRGGYPFGDRLLTRGIGRDWHSGGRLAAAQVRGK